MATSFTRVPPHSALLPASAVHYLLAALAFPQSLGGAGAELASHYMQPEGVEELMSREVNFGQSEMEAS